MMVKEKKKGKGRIIGMILVILVEILVLLGIFLFWGLKGKLSGNSEASEENRSYQTKKSRNYQKEMEQTAVVESWKIEMDEYGLLELTAKVNIPDYSQAFKNSLAEALKNSADEAEFDEELFRLAAKDKEELSFVTHEIRMNLSLVDEKKTKEDWTEEEVKEILSKETFKREMQDFAMELADLYMSISAEEDEKEKIEEGDEHE